MIKFFRHIRKSLSEQNRAECIENVQLTFLVNKPTCRVGIKYYKYD